MSDRPHVALTAARLSKVTATRARNPQAVAEAAIRRPSRGRLLGERGTLLVIAADHTARGVLRAGRRTLAMANRADLLDRLLVALSRPGVDGLLGTADIVEDLLLLGALDGKVVLGSMNRGGLIGTSFEVDDRFTGYDEDAIARFELDGGKMLLRIDPDDPATARTLEACARAVDALASRGKLALVEPFLASRVDGRLRNDLSPDAMVRAVSVASGLGRTSAYTWLKIPVVAEMERVVAATTLPTLLLGGDVADDQDEMFARWEKAVRLPTVTGLVVGRSLLYPPDDDVGHAVDTAAGLLESARGER